MVDFSGDLNSICIRKVRITQVKPLKWEYRLLYRALFRINYHVYFDDFDFGGELYTSKTSIDEILVEIKNQACRRFAYLLIPNMSGCVYEY